MLGEIVVERQFAFYFVADYEENQRLWISTGIVILSRLLTLLFTFTVMTEIYPHTWAIGGGSVSVVVLVVFATLMYRRNYSKLVELRSGVVNARTANTLCVKFQLIENVRVMKVVVVAFCIAGMLMAIGLLILSLAFYVFRKAFRKAQVCFALLDFLIALSAIGCISAFLLLIDECRRILRKTAILQMLFPTIASSVLTPCKKESIDNHRGASKQHFEHLKLAWQ
ncbi:hypothetical protein ANCCAN_20804 [Ancylostoma caninum]|uniref:Uncharacterized protein n=1 Tax=Ancylostoma caninum TaxID=29170 RepID=A0A368FMF1_ANCCA|nr:hypothetical protein ANCCAN_20804 [Ancylostoma caninum]